MPRLVDKPARRIALVEAAASAFAEKGVSNTSVSEIVKRAGVAQGTFYLYFASKDDAVLAVVERVADRMLAQIETATCDTDARADARLLGLRDALVSADTDPATMQLAAFLHRPENAALHDRLAEQLTPRLIPLVQAIVSQGVTEGVFDVPDERAAAWFVLGGLQSAELSGTTAEEMPAAIVAVTDLAMRALGYRVDAQMPPHRGLEPATRPRAARKASTRSPSP
jgi:TetR/AcrR family transcriptional regulator, fatty acid metabolism regulator protein